MTGAEWATIKHFVPVEFDSPDEPGSGEGMDYRHVRMLDYARELAGVPFVITSGYRSEAHNKKVGGRPLSAHRFFKGTDIEAATPRRRFYVLKGLYGAGFTRIEIAPGHVHADTMADEEHPSNLALYYDSATGALV